LENRLVEQVLFRELVPVGGRRRWENGEEGEYGANTAYTHM
jgi:hypothetical protein